jgi:hypothetical protein
MGVYSQLLAFMSVACCFANGDPALNPADASVGPAPACPQPNVQTTNWPVVTISQMGIRLKMPKRFAEKHWAVTIGDPIVASYRAGHFESFTLEVKSSSGHSLDQEKTIRQSDYVGYTECTELVNSHRMLIQSFRGGGATILGDRSFAPFAVMAVCELAPGRILRFDGSAATREAQEDLLMIIRTLEFTP